MKEKITWHGLNPEQLDESQSQLSPWLLLHGICHTQGVWIPFAKAMQKAGIRNPLYTMNVGFTPKAFTENAGLEKIDQKTISW